MPVLDRLRVSIENAVAGRYDEFDDRRSFDQSSVDCIQTCLEVEHDQEFKIVLYPLPGFAWAGANGFIVTIDFDEGIEVNRYEVVLVKEPLQRPSRRNSGYSNTRPTGVIDSLVLREHETHRHFRFRFIEMRQEEDRNDSLAMPASWKYQGSIRIEVTRFKVEARRNSTTPNFGEPKKVSRASRDLLRRNKITHEIDLIPAEELHDHTTKPFRTTSINKGQVGTFIFRYSGVGMLERVADAESDTSNDPQEPSMEPTYVLRDAYLVCGRQAFDHAPGSGSHSNIRKKNVHNESQPRSPSHYEAAALLKSLSDGQSAAHESGSVGEKTAIIREGEQLRHGEYCEALTITDGIHADVAQDRADDIQEEKAPRVSKLVMGELNDFDACAVKGLAKLEAFDIELDVLEARSAALGRQLKECEEGFAGVLQKRNELYINLTEQQSQSFATLQTDIEEDLRRVDSKKRKLARMKENQAQLRKEKCVRVSCEEEA